MARRLCSRDAIGSGVLNMQIEFEDASLLKVAGQLDLASGQHRQFAAYREAKAGAGILSGCTGVRLLERLEDDLLLVRRNADTLVLDDKRHDL